MKKTVVCFLSLCAALFAGSRNEDLKVILERSFLEPQAEPFLNMMAMEAISASQKKIEPEKIIEQFRNSFQNEKVLAKFFEPYQAVFSDEEISELRKIHENPVWKKYSQEAMTIVQANLQTIKETFKELADNFETEEKQEEVASEEIASNASIIQITQQAEIEEASQPLIVDVNASWCNPCRMMEPILEELSEKYEGTIQFAKIDFDSQSDLANQYGVTSLPTILFFKPGHKKPVMKHVGFMSKKEFEAKIGDFLKK